MKAIVLRWTNICSCARLINTVFVKIVSHARLIFSVKAIFKDCYPPPKKRTIYGNVRNSLASQNQTDATQEHITFYFNFILCFLDGVLRHNRHKFWKKKKKKIVQMSFYTRLLGHNFRLWTSWKDTFLLKDILHRVKAVDGHNTINMWMPRFAYIYCCKFIHFFLMAFSMSFYLC